MVQHFINYIAIIPTQMPHINQVVSGRDTKTRLISISKHANLTIRDEKHWQQTSPTEGRHAKTIQRTMY